MQSNTLVLHIGMPKCASTSIQHFLADNAALLRDHGVFYDRPPALNLNSVANADGLREVMAKKDQTSLDTYLDHFLGREGTVVLSSETLTDMARFGHPRQLVASVTARGFRLKILCVVRRQDHWIEADFKQHIKDIAPWSDPLPALIASRRQLKILDYHWLLSNWARFVDRADIFLISMRPGQPSTNVLDDMMGVLGCTALMQDCVLPAAHHSNSSHPAGMIEPARHIKRSIQRDQKTPEKVSSEVGRFFKAASALDVPPRRFLMSLAARQALVAEYAKSNARLAQDFNNGQSVFEDGFVEDLPSEEDLGDEAVAFLLQYFKKKKRLLLR